MKTSHCFGILSLLFISTPALAAGDQVATVTRTEGLVEILKNPSAQVSGEGPHVKYEGMYYTYKRAVPGAKVENGFVLRTRNNSKALVVYDNGDQFNVAPNSAYKINWKGKEVTLNLKYGKIRGIISKAGSRNRMKFRTPTATMGVRGTDFVLGSAGKGAPTEVSVIRGKVAVARLKEGRTPDAKNTAQVAAGNTVSVKTTTTKVALHKTTKKELEKVKDFSRVKKAESQDKEIVQLEKKAKNNVLEDVERYDKKLAEKLKSDGFENVDELDNAVLERKVAKAPEKSETKEFRAADINKGEQEVYDKYFNDN